MAVPDGEEGQFHFFPEFHIMRAFSAVFVIGLALVVWLPALYLFLVERVAYGPAVRMAVYATGTFCLLLLLARMSRRTMAEIRFIVSAEGIARRDPWRSVSVAWKDITSIRCRAPLFMKGFVEVSAGRRKLLLPSTITRFAELGVALRQGLAAAGRADLCTETTLRRIVAMAAVSERWNERARAAFLPIVAATFGLLLFNAAIASLVWGGASFPTIVWTGIGLPVPLLVYGIADLMANIRLEKALLSGSGFDGRNGFRRELRLAVLAAVPVYGLFGLVFKGIFIP